MHNEEPLQNLATSLTALKELIRSESGHIRQGVQQRDLYATRHRAAVENCANLAIAAAERALQVDE